MISTLRQDRSGPSRLVFWSTASTEPESPTSSAIHETMDPAPAPSSAHFHPARTPMRLSRRMESRISDCLEESQAINLIRQAVIPPIAVIHGISVAVNSAPGRFRYCDQDRVPALRDHEGTDSAYPFTQ